MPAWLWLARSGRSSLAFLAQPDSLAAVTVFPTWVWTLVGLVLAGAAALGLRSRRVAVVLVVWSVTGALLADELPALLRHRSEAQQSPRVVSLNCAGGSSEAAAEVEALHPDVVLLQESPRRDAMEALARHMYGEGRHLAWTPEASILARGDVESLPLPTPVRVYAALARITLADNHQIHAVSLRLAPPIFRLDLWSPSCWRDQTARTKLHREQLEALLTALPSHHRTWIVGGDFNAPAHDAVFQLLSPWLADAHAMAGVGWGDTVSNALPALRIDQLWLSPDLQPIRLQALPTRNSDHRMVVCDLQ